MRIAKKIIFVVIAIVSASSADLALLNKYSHKTRFNLEQMAFKADCILIVKKDVPFISEKVLEYKKGSKCPPFHLNFYHFTVLEVIKCNTSVSKGNHIKVKEPFSDLSYTVHYSFYTRGFVIEPFIGEYYPEIVINKTEKLIVFVNALKNKDSGEISYQFSLVNAYESVKKRTEIVQILNRPAADMKRLFLKPPKKTGSD